MKRFPLFRGQPRRLTRDLLANSNLRHSGTGGDGGGGGNPTGPSTVTITDSNSNTPNGSFQSFALNLPATVNAGDILYAYTVVSDPNMTFQPPPTGWTSLGTENSATNGALSSVLWTKVAAGTEGGTTVTVSTLDPATRWAGISVAVDGGTHDSVFVSKGTTPGSNNYFDVLSQDWTSSGAVLQFVGTNDDGDGGTMPPSSAPTGYILLERQESGGRGSNLVGAKLVWRIVEDTGSTGNVRFQTESLDGGDVDFFNSHLVLVANE